MTALAGIITTASGSNCIYRPATPLGADGNYDTDNNGLIEINNLD